MSRVGKCVATESRVGVPGAGGGRGEQGVTAPHESGVSSGDGADVLEPGWRGGCKHYLHTLRWLILY